MHSHLHEQVPKDNREEFDKMEPFRIHTTIIEKALEPNMLSTAELIRRCQVVDASRLTQIRKSSYATEPDVLDLAQALRVDVRVLTDATGKMYEIYLNIRLVLEEEGRPDDTSAYNQIFEKAARSTDGFQMDKQRIRNLLKTSWNQQPPLF